MGQVPFNHRLILIGDGRLARHLSTYFGQLGLPFGAWSRRAQAEGRVEPLARLIERAEQPVSALLAIKDSAIEPFVASEPMLARCTRVHFAGRLTTPMA